MNRKGVVNVHHANHKAVSILFRQMVHSTKNNSVQAKARDNNFCFIINLTFKTFKPIDYGKPKIEQQVTTVKLTASDLDSLQEICFKMIILQML